MIRVELRTDRQHQGTTVLATLTIRDDRSHRVTGDRGVIDLSELLLDFPGPRRIRFHDDPARWARALPRNICSPYLYAVIVEDGNDAGDDDTGGPRPAPARRFLPRRTAVSSPRGSFWQRRPVRSLAFSAPR